MRGRAILLLLLAALSAVSLALEPSFEEFRAIHDSLLMQPPRLRARWLDERGLEMPGWNAPLPSTSLPDSGGLRLVGKWGRGAAQEVTVRDSIVFLALGSEVAIINMSDPDNPIVLSESQAASIVVQVAVRDSFLYMGTWAGIEVWNIGDLTLPVFRSRTATPLDDFCIQDTLAYVVLRGSSTSVDSFKVFNLADPENPRIVGWSLDNGTNVAVSGDKAVVSDWYTVRVMDISDPEHPHRVGSLGGDAIGVDVRGNLACVAKYWNGDQDDDRFWFDLYDISNPSAPRFLGELAEVGGYDIHVSGPLAFVSGFYHSYVPTIVDISDSTNPRLVSQCATDGDRCGIWADWTSDWAYVADRFAGLTVLDISNLNAPVVDTSFMGTGAPYDVDVRDSLMLVATSSYGLQIVDVADPAKPVQLYSGVRLGEEAVAIGDSFAYVDTFAIEDLCVLDITDPHNPVRVGRADLFNPYEDLVLQDSFLYVVEMYRFEVVNVARPREPELVGSCQTGDIVWGGLSVRDTLAFLGNYPAQIVNVADPTNPRVVGTFGRGAYNVSPRDTFAFVSLGGVLVYSIADPTRPRLVDSISLGPNTFWVEAVGNLLYTGNRDGVHVVDASDVHNMREVAFHSTPNAVKRLHYDSPYVYAACWDYGGVSIFEYAPAAIVETPPAMKKRMGATLVRGMLQLPGKADAELLDICGRRVMDLQPGTNDVRHVAPGVYFLRSADSGERSAVRKIVIQR